MLDLNRIKLALFDFEDALCVPTERAGHDLNWLGHNTFAYCVAPQFMKQFVGDCMRRGIDIGLVSDADTYLIAASMLLWANETYGVEFENYMVSGWKQKVPMLHKLQASLQLAPHQILYIDSNSLSLKFASNDGFTACSPAEIAYYLEQR